MTREDTLALVRRVLRESKIPRAVLARDANISRATLESWVAGVREPRANSLQHLAAGLERRAAILSALAAAVRSAAEE